MIEAVCVCGEKYVANSSVELECLCGAVVTIGNPIHKIQLILPKTSPKLIPTSDVWGLLHGYSCHNAAHWNPQVAMDWYYTTWLPLVPVFAADGGSCGGCKTHWSDLTAGENCPDFSTPEAFFEWGYRRHDDVSKLHSGAPRILLEDAYLLHWKTFRPVTSDLPLLNPKNDRLIITVATGPCEDLIGIVTPQMRHYAEKCEADFVCLSGVTQGWWGLEKFRIQPFVNEYKQTLFLDIDVWVMGDAPNIFEIQGTALHDDLPINGGSWAAASCCDVFASQRVQKSWSGNWLLNSGVVLTDSPGVWAPPPYPLPGEHCDEQFWVEHNIEEIGCPVTMLDTRFNAQYWMPDFESLRQKAWFIHYANHPDKKQALLSHLGPVRV